MKKITSLLMMFMLFLGMGWAQETTLPVKTSVEGGEMHYYAIKSLKKNKYVFGAWGYQGRLVSDKNTANATWYFLPVEGEPNKVIIKNCFDKTLNVAGWAFFGATSADKFTIALQDKSTTDYYIQPADGDTWNDANGWGNQIDHYGKNDGGSAFQFEEVTSVPSGVMPEQIKAFTETEKTYYSIQSARTGKYLVFDGENGIVKQSGVFTDKGYFYFEGSAAEGYSIKNVFGGNLNIDGDNVKLTEGTDKWKVSLTTDNNKHAGVGAVYIKRGNNHLNAFGGNDNVQGNGIGGTLGQWTGVDVGDEWILNEVTLPKKYEDWTSPSTSVEKNGIKYSSFAFDGTKYYYTIEGLRQHANYRYAYTSHDIKTETNPETKEETTTESYTLKLSVTPDNESNKWYFLRGNNPDAVIIVNAQYDAYLNAVNGGMSFDAYKDFYIVPSQYHEGWKCISDNATEISKDTHCLDATNHGPGLSPGWHDVNEADAGTAWKISEVAPYKVALRSIQGKEVTGTTKTHIASFSHPLNVTIPSGVEAYTINEQPGAFAKLVKYNESVLPANTGVILLGDAAEYSFEPVFQPVTAVAGNLLKNTANHKTVSMVDGDYILATPNTHPTQFYSATVGSSLALNKAYLHLTTAQAAKFSLNFGDEVTGVEGVEVEDNTNAPIYDLSGRRVMNTVKGGIYIQNGKKFIVK